MVSASVVVWSLSGTLVMTSASAILRTLSSLKALSRNPAMASALPILGTLSGIAISVHSIHNGYGHDLKLYGNQLSLLTNHIPFLLNLSSFGLP
jgi:hypothetical protein